MLLVGNLPSCSLPCVPPLAQPCALLCVLQCVLLCALPCFYHELHCVFHHALPCTLLVVMVCSIPGGFSRLYANKFLPKNMSQTDLISNIVLILWSTILAKWFLSQFSPQHDILLLCMRCMFKMTECSLCWHMYVIDCVSSSNHLSQSMVVLQAFSTTAVPTDKQMFKMNCKRVICENKTNQYYTCCLLQVVHCQKPRVCHTLHGVGLK